MGDLATPPSYRRHRTYPLRTGIPRKETGGRIARTGREPEKARTKTGIGQKQTERRKGQGKKGSGKVKKQTQKQRPGGRREGGPPPQAARNPSRGRKKKGETKRLERDELDECPLPFIPKSIFHQNHSHTLEKPFLVCYSKSRRC